MEATKAQETWCKRQDLIEAGVPEALAGLWANAVDEARRADEDLTAAALEVAFIAERTVRYVNEGYSVNSLGELQSSGVTMDRLCGVRQAAHQLVTRIQYTLNVSYPGAEAVLGGVA